MTPLEEKSLDTFKMILDRFTHPKITHMDYLDFLGKIREMVMCLEALQSGCASGEHVGYCTCKPGKPGVNLNSHYYAKYRHKKKAA